MNQKNIFTIIGAVLMLQGIMFYATQTNMVSSTFPGLDAAGSDAAGKLLQVMAALSVIVGLISFAARTSPQVLWAYTAGFCLLSLLTLKHMFVDHVNVPIFAIIIQLAIVLACSYLWMQSGKSQAS